MALRVIARCRSILTTCRTTRLAATDVAHVLDQQGELHAENDKMRLLIRSA